MIVCLCSHHLGDEDSTLVERELGEDELLHTCILN